MDTNTKEDNKFNNNVRNTNTLNLFEIDNRQQNEKENIKEKHTESTIGFHLHILNGIYFIFF